MEANIREIQYVQLILAKEIKRICEKYDIKYFLIDDTLLEAVMRGGFESGNVGMDIGMERHEFQKFLGTLVDELSVELHCQPWFQDYLLPYVQIIAVGTKITEENEKNERISYPIHVNIVPYDAISDNLKVRRKQYKKQNFYLQLLYAKNNYNASFLQTELKSWKSILIKCCSFFCNDQKIRKKCYQLITGQGNKKTQNYFAFGSPFSLEKGKMRREWIENLAPVRFENEMFLAPAGSKEYLTFLYGDDMKFSVKENRINNRKIVDVDFGCYWDR